jgi:hypothetical protein
MLRRDFLFGNRTANPLQVGNKFNRIELLSVFRFDVVETKRGKTVLTFRSYQEAMVSAANFAKAFLSSSRCAASETPASCPPSLMR